mmetsp:Transcript_27143/g.78037  ORF Transcript_27143/g.78037 Transcript_27143/m.78037 type:complete len:81 (+) Transcript_27143:666-908(+)
MTDWVVYRLTDGRGLHDAGAGVSTSHTHTLTHRRVLRHSFSGSDSNQPHLQPVSQSVHQRSSAHDKYIHSHQQPAHQHDR